LKIADWIPKGELCEFGACYGICFDEYPPFRIWKARHEVFLPDTKETMYVCSYHLNIEFIDNEEKEEGIHYELDNIDKKALEEWDDDASKRESKYAEYLDRDPKRKILKEIRN